MDGLAVMREACCCFCLLRLAHAMWSATTAPRVCSRVAASAQVQLCALPGRLCMRARARQGPFDAAFFNAVFGNVYDQQEALLRACLLLKPGARPRAAHGGCAVRVGEAGPACKCSCVPDF